MSSAQKRRTLRFAVSIASLRIFPDRHLIGGHAIGSGYWYTFEKEAKALTEAEVQQISVEVQSLSNAGVEIKADTLPYADAYAWLNSNQQSFAAAWLRTNVRPEVAVWSCMGQYRLRHHDLFASFAQLGSFELRPYRGGFIAIYDTVGWVDQPAIADSFRDHVEWSATTGVQAVGHVNELLLKGDREIKDYMLHSEFRQEDKLSTIAQIIKARGKGQPNSVRVLCIAGPTSSGKTTFATKLAMYLRNYGFHAKALSVDHYYFSLPDQPRFKIRGLRTDVDYDSLDSMDVDLVGQHVTALISGHTVETPVYNFATGMREAKGHSFTLPENGILVLEGIHALNPEYSRGVPQESVYRIYISPLTGLQLDDFNVVKTTNHRCLRRLCRDSKFRGYTASRVLQMWPKVRDGEHAYIFPHQNNADFVMNSATEYELPVLKLFTQPLLKVVAPSSDVYVQCSELLGLLDSFAPWPSKDVPSTSLLREFIGDGAFDCH